MKDKTKSPNYLMAIIVSLIVTAVCVGVSFSLKKSPPVMAIAGVIGFALSMLIMVSRSAVDDSKRALVEAGVNKKLQEARSAIALDRMEKAEPLLKQVLESTSSLGKSHPSRLQALSSLATLYMKQRKYSLAKEVLVQRTEIYDGAGDLSLDAIEPVLDLVETELNLNNAAGALTQVKRTFPALEKIGDLSLVRALSLQVRALRAQGQNQESLPILQRIKTFRQKLIGDFDIRVICTSLELGRTYAHEKQLPEALESYKDVLVRLSKSEQSFRNIEVEALLEMAQVCLDAGQIKNVEPLCLNAFKVLQQHVGPDNGLLDKLFKLYQDCLQKQGLPLVDNDFFYLFSRDADTVRDLLKQNVDWLLQKDKSGWTPLHWCCFLKRDELLKWMIRNGSKLESGEAGAMEPIHVAAAWYKMSGISAMIEAGCAVDIVGPNGWTPLLFAASVGKQETVEQLIIRGANVNHKDSLGRTALHLAAQNGYADIVLVLLEKGCERNLPETKFGRTPLHLAAQYGHGSVVNLLLNNQADLKAKDAAGKTAAQLAEEAGHSLLVQAIRFQENLSKDPAA
jgi:hypothetical protein